MDIPSSGAIFTLGKSHLAENTQSYFYIKNDPVKRLISGPHQSAVICESGRLFVWGENHYGQLGIGGHGHKNNNNNNSNNNNDIVSKPTCVKSLKTLGLKICDAAYGSNWAVIMTLSNEIFFTGRNIFPLDTHVAQHFIDAVVEQQSCAIIRKPFRLEEFDDYLSKNEETDNFTALQAGNEHFVVLTTKGRLIGCGSNSKQQLGDLELDYDGHPVEIQLDAAVQQFACGPESTLVLTASGNLFLTGRLNEFVFPKFTELQKNLSQTEQIIFMHISKASEIFIVTNVGSIYRSFESVRSKSLVFQRFYDYDSEENGPIWKLLKGVSFYAVLSKAHKFFTTFSESGHHLKTFREISKFKNLRLLDIAVGEQHILVHGLPRSTNLSATIGAKPEASHSYMSRSFVLQPTDTNGNSQLRSASGKSLTKQQALKETEADASQELNGMGSNVAAVGAVGATVATLEAVKHMSVEQHVLADLENNVTAEQESKGAPNMQTKEKQEIEENTKETTKMKEMNGNAEQTTMESNNSEEKVDKQESTINNANPQKETKLMDSESEHMQPSAPLESPVKQDTEAAAAAAAVETIVHLPTPPVQTPSPEQSSKDSLNSSKFPSQEQLSTQNSQDKQLRPRTPYPESSNSSTPQTVKKTPIRNFSYEAAMNHDEIEKTSPELVDSLDTVEENPYDESAPPTAIQVSTPTPPTEEDEQLAVEITTTEDVLDSSKLVNEIRFINNGIDVTANVDKQMPDTPLADSSEELDSEGELHVLEEHINKVVAEQKEEAVEATESVGNTIESKLLETRNTIQTAVSKAATGARDAAEAASDRVVNGARDAVDAAGKNAHRLADGARDAVNVAGKSAQRMADDARQSMEQVGNTAAKVAADTKESIGKTMSSMANKISSEVQGAKENISSVFQIKAAKDTQPKSTTTPASTPEEAAPKTSSETSGSGEPEIEGEEDERTTASVNSNHNSAGNGNAFEPMNINSHAYEDDPLNAIVERGKKAMQEELRAKEQQGSRTQPHINNPSGQQDSQSTESKGLVQQFLDGMRLSCRNEKAVQIDDDPPPASQSAQHYNKNKVNSELSVQNEQKAAQQSSRVCTIL